MKVLFVGDAVVKTGFSRCTHAACDAMSDSGVDVVVLGINHNGDPHNYPYPIYPAHNPRKGGHDQIGVGRLESLSKELDPDCIILLTDPWHVPAYLNSIHKAGKGEIPVIAWLAVDGVNQKGYQLNKLAHVIVWTEFAKNELIRSGYTGSISIVPLGVDTNLFNPKDRTESRRIACPPDIAPEDFVVLVLGRNQPRKRIDLSIQYYAEFVHRHNIEDSVLYLHVAPTGERGCDIGQLVEYYGLGGKKRVVLNETIPGVGEPDAYLPYLYSACDLYFSTTKGEGWGLPCLEALACGTHALVPDWSGLGCWTRDAVVKVPCTATELIAPLNNNPYVIGGIMDKEEAVRSLHAIYQLHRENRLGPNKHGIDLAQILTWKSTGQLFLHEVIQFC